jgi:bacterioferritin
LQCARDLFAAVLSSEEEHVDTLEKQFDLIKRIGIENYFQLNSEAVAG